MFLRLSIILSLLGLSGFCPADERTEFFESKIRPILATHCFECHGHKAKGGLKLNSLAAALKGGESGAAIIPGKPEQSRLIRAISHRDPELSMPPKSLLPNHVIANLTRWIREGAHWTSDAEIAFASGAITEAQRNHWSFQPVQKPALPDAPKDWSHPIDAFIHSAMSKRGLEPVERASRLALIRRATFNLTGLPPSMKQIDRFLSDRSPDAWRKLYERLLASQQYGERWGRHWLDLVRYADTAGDAADFPVPEAFKYRNYVINAFNSDKPYDQFVREQIAGDLLPAKDDDGRWEQTIATGYLAISRRIGVSPHGMRHITLEDTINNVGKTFLGLSVGCARCHDHKFDPIPTADYYALYGIFNSTVYPHAGAEHKPYREDFVYRVGKTKANELLKPHRAKLASWDKRERDKFFEYKSFQTKEVKEAKTRESTWAELQVIRANRAAVAATFPELEIAFAASEGNSEDAHVMKQGDHRRSSRGEIVRRGFLQILGGQKLPENAMGSGRRELADWLTDPANPLTARVMVNRIWHYHFGRGLVDSTSDFGVRGTAPTHPELLDYLAAHFVEHGWSIKEMHRLILSSKAYQLANTEVTANLSEDPDNKLHWRSNRQRLDAEQLRDSILSFTGQLDLTPGGRHPFPHHLTYFYRQHEPFQEKYTSNRRSVYQMQQRIQKNPYLDLFDGPDGNLHFGKRRESTTTLQALYFMNSHFVHEQVEAIAKRASAVSDEPAEVVNWLYQTIFNRPPTNAELDFAKSRNPAWPSFVRAMLASNEFIYVD